MAQAVTGSIALEQLKTDLTTLANNLRELHSTLISQMNTLGDSWQDSQYQQFVDGYKPQIEKCASIADRYDYGCKNFLSPQIENVRAIEQTDLSGGNGGGFSGAGAAGIGAAGAAVVGAGAIGINAMRGGSSKSGNLNAGMFGGISPAPPAENQVDAQRVWEEKHQMSLDTEHYYIDQNGNAVRKTVGVTDDLNAAGSAHANVQGGTAGVAGISQEASDNGNTNSTVSTSERVCTTEGVDVFGTGAHGKTCETTYPDGSKKTEIETCTQAGVSVNGLGGLGAEAKVEGCKITEIYTPAPSDGDVPNKTAPDEVLGNGTDVNETVPPVEEAGRRVVPRPQRGGGSDTSIDVETKAASAENVEVSSPSQTHEEGAFGQTGKTEMGFTSFPNASPSGETIVEAPLPPTDSAGNTPTAIDETTVTNTTINNISENTIVNNTTVNNTTVNNTTINNTTINETIINKSTVNSATENIVVNDEPINNLHASDVITKNNTNSDPILPKQDSNSVSVDNTEYNKSGNPSGINDIPYTPFPETSNHRNVVPRPIPEPAPEAEPVPSARRSMLGGKLAGTRVSGMSGDGHSGRVSPREPIVDNQTEDAKAHKRIIDAQKVASIKGKQQKGHRKDRFGI